LVYWCFRKCKSSHCWQLCGFDVGMLARWSSGVFRERTAICLVQSFPRASVLFQYFCSLAIGDVNKSVVLHKWGNCLKGKNGKESLIGCQEDQQHSLYANLFQKNVKVVELGENFDTGERSENPKATKIIMKS